VDAAGVAGARSIGHVLAAKRAMLATMLKARQRSCRKDQAVVLAVLAALLGGCSTSAVIERRNGPTVIGVIDASDGNRLFVSADDGPRFAIERGDIVDIDHPGRRNKIAGGLLTGGGFGLLGLAFIIPDNCPRDAVDCLGAPAAAAIVGISALLVGLPLWIRGIVVNDRSRAAADPVPSSAAPSRK
jgi:hypothetical protein